MLNMNQLLEEEPVIGRSTKNGFSEKWEGGTNQILA